MKIMEHKAKKFPIKDFVDLGILQEINRVFFHPLGLGLVVDLLESGRVKLHSIIQTTDPEGFEFGEIDQIKANKFFEWVKKQAPQRTAMAKSKGWVSKIQPINE